MGRKCKTETAPRAPLVALALFFSLLLLVSLCLLLSFAMANAWTTLQSFTRDEKFNTFLDPVSSSRASSLFPVLYRPTSSRAGEDPSSRARLSWSRLCLAGPWSKGEFADFSSESPPIESGTFKGTSLSLASLDFFFGDGSLCRRRKEAAEGDGEVGRASRYQLVRGGAIWPCPEEDANNGRVWCVRSYFVAAGRSR